MPVRIFEQITPVQKEVSPEELELYDKLGLKSMKKKLEAPEQDVIPYINLTPIQKEVYSTYYRTDRKLKDFDEASIPIDVLKEIDFIRDNFKDITINFDKDDHKKGFLVMGHTKDTYYTDGVYLIAYWGDSPAPEYKDVLVAASRKFVAETVQRLEEIAATVNMDITKLRATNPDTAILEVRSRSASYYGCY
jgi:hypothetical protein